MIKSQIRNKIIKVRNKKFDKNLKIDLDKFISFLKIKKLNSKNVGGYYPSNYEIDDLELLVLLKKKNFKVSLPIIKKNNQMNFYSWSRNNPLKINKFGIPEPLASKIIYPDILLVPLVAYDGHLNRLGYGGGYYDHTISNLKEKNGGSVIVVGVGREIQRVHAVPNTSNDQKLDFILTEENFERVT